MAFVVVLPGRRRKFLLLSVATACLGAPSPRPTFELKAEKAFKSSEVDDIDDDYLTNLDRKTTTECFTGSQEYELTRVFCDAVCRRSESARRAISERSGRGDDSRTDAEHCNGPWYCSRQEICETFHKSDPNSAADARKSCLVVRSCANHTHCFPTDEDADNMNILFRNQTAKTIRDHGFRAFYGGMSFRTTCCENRPNYRPGIDLPCNAATTQHLSFLLIFFSCSGLLAWLLI